MTTTEQVRKWRAKNPTRWRQHVYKYLYGISMQEYNALFATQNGLCAGCYRHQSQFTKRFGVDHDHKTGRVRGLLCRDCNFILGLAKDSAQTLERLAKML